MTTSKKGITRRHYLAASGAGVLAAGLGMRPGHAALATVRQGYQTNMWGMPTYYLMKSGILEKHGVKVEEFAVPSGNLTMQQMVARQVDMGTYAGVRTTLVTRADMRHWEYRYVIGATVSSGLLGSLERRDHFVKGVGLQVARQVVELPGHRRLLAHVVEADHRRSWVSHGLVRARRSLLRARASGA